MRQESSTSWITIIIVLVLFWPVGLILLFKKLSSDRSATFSGGSIITFIGWALFIFGLMGIIMAFDDPEMVSPGITVLVIFGIPGLLLIKKGKTTKKQGLKYKKYIQVIINEEVTDIDEIAAIMKKPSTEVYSDICEMISKGLLGSAKINKSRNTIDFIRPQYNSDNQEYVNVNKTPQMQTAYTYGTQAQYKQEPVVTFEPKTIRCKACSANNFVESLPAQCDYCGSSLHE